MMQRQRLPLARYLLAVLLFVAFLSVASVSYANPYSQYVTYNCTWYAWQQVHERLGIDLPSWGNAGTWLSSAAGAGLETGSEARADSLVVWEGGSYGHVAYVTEVNATQIKVIEGGRPRYPNSIQSSGEWAPKAVGSKRWADEPNACTKLLGYIYFPKFNHAIDTFTSDSTNSLHIAGWLYNKDNSSASIQIHVYMDAPAGSSQLLYAKTADLQRDVVNNAFGISGRHGFDFTIPNIPTGNHTFYLYALDQYTGKNAPLGTDYEKTIFINTAGSVMTTTSERVIPDGDYIIASTGMSDKNRILYLDIPGTNQANVYEDSFVNVHTRESGEIQACDTWTVKYDSSHKYYTIKQKGTNMALVVDPSQFSLSGARMKVTGSSGADYEYWKISKNNKDGYCVQSYTSGFALDVKGANFTAGAHAQQWMVNNGAAQSWVFIPYITSQPFENDRYLLFSSLGESIVLDAANDSNVQIWKATETDHNNAYDLTKLPNGYYKIKHVATGKCLDVAGGASTYGKNVQLFADNGGLAQQWAIRANGNGYMLISRCNGYALEVNNSATANGTNVQVNPVSGATNQTWRIVSEEVAVSYTITYDANGGENPPAPETVAGGSTTIPSNTPTKEGYDFLGWSTSQTASEAMYQPGDVYSGGTATLYAIWRIKMYAVSFDSDTVPRMLYLTRLIEYGNPIGDLPEPTLYGKFFVGWFDGDGNRVTSETIVRSNLVLTAHWVTASVTKMQLPGALTTIEDEAFEGMNAGIFIIPASVTAIGSKAFAYNTNLHTVVCYSRTVIPANDAFVGCSNLTVYGYADTPINDYANAKQIPFKTIEDGAGWVLYSDIPVGATVSEEKWTYTETTETTEPSMAGWTQTGTKWRETNRGAWTYATYPNGFNKDHALYNAHGKAAKTSTESATAKVEYGASAVNSYIFWQWAYTDQGYVNEEINDFEGSDGRYEYHLFHAFETVDSLDGDRRGLTKDGIERQYDNIWSTYHYPQYGQYGPWWWWRLTVYRQDYVEYEKVYSYTRQSESTTEVQPSDSISNVQHLVKYGF